jgi:hypothetical protein
MSWLAPAVRGAQWRWARALERARGAMPVLAGAKL